jgi:colanic acid/amylovoran biosynthesis glycosyltransferase
MPLTIAYLVNQYPKVSHSFIRREILALEDCGMSVLRFSIRSRAHELVDEADKQELEKTRFVLGVGLIGLLFRFLQVAVSRPVRFLKALGLALKIGWRSEQGLLLHLAYLAEACVLLNWFSQDQVTHVHAHFGTNSTTVVMLCQAIGGPPYSFTVHGPEEFDKVKAIALPEKIKRAAFVVAISNFGKSQLYRWCEATEWAKIHLIHCGVDQDFLTQPAVALPDIPQLVCVGRLCEDKGQLLLLQAAKQLASEGFKFKLVLVGDGPLRSQLETSIAQFNLENYVEITGWASSAEVRQYILASRVMVLPSFAEGLPVVIMESLALGRPVISTSVAGIPELVRPGLSGWLVPPGTVEELLVAMRSALQLPLAELEQMGRAGAAQVAQQHDIHVEARRLVALLHSSHQSHPSQTEITQPDLLRTTAATPESNSGHAL